MSSNSHFTLNDDKTISELFDDWRSDNDEQSIDNMSEKSPDEVDDQFDDLHKLSNLSTLSPPEQVAALKRLTKKHKKSIPTLAPYRRRSRPICMFVNYLGTRKPEPTPMEEPSSHPTDPPSKRQKLGFEVFPQDKKRIEPSPNPSPFPSERMFKREY